MDMCRTSVFVALVLFQFNVLPFGLAKLPLPSKVLDDKDTIEEVQVNIKDEATRPRRSIDNVLEPSTKLSVSFILHHKNLTLHLVRNDEISNRVPIYVTDSDGKIKTQEIRQETDGYFYQDVRNNAAFYVEGNDNPACMFGSFTSDDHDYLLRPGSVSCGDAASYSSQHFKIQRIRIPEFQDNIAEKLTNTGSIESGATYRGRVKRNTVTDYKVELLMVVDYSIYTYWYDASTQTDRDADAKAVIRQFYAFIINSMDVRYKNIETTDYTISIVFAGIYIADTVGKSTWTETVKETDRTPNAVSANSVLTNLQAWGVANTATLPGHDHAMLFSRYDFYSTSSGTKNYANAGLASLNAMCTTNSQSITEEMFDFTAVTVAAHELGHSLSAQHDGEGNGCNGNDAFIMAASSGGQTEATASNPWKFSSCSTQYFTSLINTLNLGTNCLTTLSTGFDPTALAQYDGLLPGQVYDADTQCQHIQGQGSYLKRSAYNGNYSSICYKMWCADPDPTSSTYYSALAMEGTTCGDKQWCITGQCVYSDNAPSGNETCLYGSSRGTVITYNGSPLDCAAYIAINPQTCASGDWNSTCCSECQQYYTGNASCPYGDRPGAVITFNGVPTSCVDFIGYDPTYCLQSGWDVTCCEQCAKYYTGIPGCLYETNAGIVFYNGALRNCEQFIALRPDQCYSSTYSTRCCEQCEDIKTTIPDCLYGDKVTSCSTNDCATNGVNCYQTCHVSSSTSTLTATQLSTSATPNPSTYQTTTQQATFTTAPRDSTVTNLDKFSTSKTTTTTSTSLNETCLYGSTRGTVITYNGSPLDCAAYITLNPQTCASGDWNSTCCSECQQYYTGNASCPYGDRPGSDINFYGVTSSCVDFIGMNPVYCLLNDWDVTCCEQCTKYYTGIPGCLYETNAEIAFYDGELRTCEQFIALRPDFCYNSTYSSVCCEQCENRKTIMPDCIYGDKITSCSTNDCATDRENCCQTCHDSSSTSTLSTTQPSTSATPYPTTFPTTTQQATFTTASRTSTATNFDKFSTSKSTTTKATILNENEIENDISLSSAMFSAAIGGAVGGTVLIILGILIIIFLLRRSHKRKKENNTYLETSGPQVSEHHGYDSIQTSNNETAFQQGDVFYLEAYKREGTNGDYLEIVAEKDDAVYDTILNV